MSVIGFPLLLIPLAICNIIVFLMPGVLLTEPVFTLTLVSGAAWPVTLGDVLLALGIVLLLFEIIKGSRAGGKYLTDHVLALVVFGAAAAEFVMLPQFGSSTFFMLTLLALVDFLSGIALRSRRPARAKVAPSQPAAEASASEPRFDPPPVSAPASVSPPAPASGSPMGAPIAQSPPNSAPEPVVVHLETAADVRPPDIPADIQPASATQTPSGEPPKSKPNLP
ncbi:MULTISPECIES: hypothetical protein [unclassified Nitrobacter]|uniref:hypothetical protein n=1 Tax=unclassified Nitrobacter TaxID=2620411 RepID=UPI0009286D99|nr:MULTISPECIES: hypothetical protein [unclassified Nitrobacter]MBN9149562.1 hypothetical protein [Nitrobacter sp.]OJV03598.1 MAG: hypothetical protein BGO16_01640 [Nitrobacter sp. 62-23]